MENTSETSATHRKKRSVFALLAVVVLVALGAGTYLLLRDSDDATPTAGTPPFAVSAAGLATLAKAVPDAIYWAGPRDAKLYELTRTAEGNVFVRYLPEGVDAGSKVDLFTVATYPASDAYAAAWRTAGQSGNVAVQTSAGAIAFRSKSSRKNVYLAFRGQNVQIEVFSSRPGEAERAVRAGEIVRVGR